MTQTGEFRPPVKLDIEALEGLEKRTFTQDDTPVKNRLAATSFYQGYHFKTKQCQDTLEAIQAKLQRDLSEGCRVTLKSDATASA
jgi:hypothetical protein